MKIQPKRDYATTHDGVNDQFVSFDEDHSGGKYDTLIIKREQWIPNWYIDSLKDERIDTDHHRMGDFVRLASVPVTVYERWLREGYDMGKEPAQKTIDRLKKEELDAFLTTTKRFGR